eukprot:2142556-Pyramimonas_sp.AAC.1
MLAFLERGWPAKVAKGGPKGQGCKGTLGKVAHPYYASRLYVPLSMLRSTIFAQSQFQTGSEQRVHFAWR